MAKGYWVGHVDISDPDAYKKYQAANAAAFRKYGARFLVRGGQANVVEGQTRSRHVVLEFPDYASALACYQSTEYQAALALRQGISLIDLAVIEGYDGPQP
jgi:uncharacterized protein (DUF1330 family)